MNICIFRNVNNCRCCNFKAKNNYCNLHTNNRNIIYEIIYNAIGSNQIKTNQEIYQIFDYIYNNANIYTKELIFKKILTSLFIKPIFLKNIYPNLNNNINEIFNLNLNTYMIKKKLEKNNFKELKIIKRTIQLFIIKSHIYNPKIIYTNSNDPFTFDMIDDIPFKERFIFNDNNNYYCFRANEFKYFISTNGNWNPYTKRPISCKIIRNLIIYIDYNNLEIKKENKWTTLNQAYTDVSQSIEKIGFYTNTEWFLKLTSKQVKNIIKLFKLISGNNNYFNEINEDNIFYDFAKEIIDLFEDGNTKFLFCCNFMKCLGIYSTDFYNSLPEWLSDIENPIIINANNRNYEIVYLINIIDG
jgi:hypothetical protein